MDQSTFEQGKRLASTGVVLCIPTVGALFYGWRRRSLNSPRTDRGKVVVITLIALAGFLLVIIGLALMVAR